MNRALSSLARLPRFVWALLLFLPLTAWMLANMKPIYHEDVCFILYAVMNSGTFFEPHDRYSDFVTQLFPLWLTWAEESPRVIANAFLLNLGLYYTGLACICVAISRSNFALCVLGLLVYAGLGEVLYWPISDFALGYGALVPVAAVLLDPEGNDQSKQWWQLAWGFLCFVLALYFHPAVPLGAAGLIVLSILEARRFDWRHGVLLAFLAIYGFYKCRSADSYEATHMTIGGWSEGREADLRMIFTVLVPIYGPLLLFVGYAFYRARTEMGWVFPAAYGGALGFFLCFYLPSNIYIQGGLYRSNLFIPVAFFLAVGGCYALFKTKAVAMPWAPVLVASALGFMIAVSLFFSNYMTRYERVQKLVDEARQFKAPLAYLNTGPEFDNLRYSWGISVDTLIWSSMDGGEVVTVVQETTLHQLYGAGYRDEHEHFAAGYCVRPTPFAKMNPVYFKFAPGPYQPIPSIAP